ncbi:hypothetical protein BKA63DRAFT_376533, partial [Paraphoma chrysanthemicola]
PIEEVAHDDLCPICQLLLFTPVRTQCNHLLCASCMAQWADVSSTNQIEHSSLDVNLTDFDPNYDPTYDLEANCPMCRTHTTASPDGALAKRLETKYPTTYAERRVEEEVERGARPGQDGVEGVMMLVGNKHRLVRGADDDNQHDWTFFVRISRPELVEEVRINLHPTFRPPRLVLRNAPYEVRRLGWGWFTIEAEIILKEPYKWIVENGRATQRGLELTWLLDFEGRGRQGRVKGRVKKIEEDVLATERATRSSPVRWPHMDDNDDEDDEDDEDYTENNDLESASDMEEEDVSEYVNTPQ